jgi:hypothetical protein
MKWLLLVAMLSLAACGFAAPTAIDGTEVGREVTCRTEDTACFSLMASLKAAAEAEVDPAKLPVIEGHAYPLSEPPHTSGGRFYVVALKLQDGSRQVVQIVCALGVSPADECYKYVSGV